MKDLDRWKVIRGIEKANQIRQQGYDAPDDLRSIVDEELEAQVNDNLHSKRV